jgi:hypothetical protein
LPDAEQALQPKLFHAARLVAERAREGGGPVGDRALDAPIGSPFSDARWRRSLQHVEKTVSANPGARGWVNASMAALFPNRLRKDNDTLLAVLCARRQAGEATVKVTESKDLKKGTRVYWRGDATDSGVITETSWDAVQKFGNIAGLGLIVLGTVTILSDTQWI